MTRRKLTPEEIDLWHRVVEKADRLHVGSVTPRPLPKPKPTKRPQSGASPPSQQPDARQKPVTYPAFRPPAPPAVQMDNKKFSRMKRGKIVPERRIDLHGMTLARAQPELTRFILSSQASGCRLVLVITGKGGRKLSDGPVSDVRGILRRYVPQWLAMPPLSQAVLQVNSAHISHGGEGALYVYLRKSR